MKNLVSVIKEYLANKYEKEWFEIKENWYEPNQLGEYISSLSNVAAMKGEEYAYMVWGVNDKTFDITGTEFDYNKKYRGEPLIHYLARLLLDFGDVLNIPQADERNRTVERKEVMLFNQDAFREAVINAYVHNDWIDSNAPIISVFSDRIEILSRGGMPAEQTKEDFFKGVSKPVNEELATIFLQLHISERSGRGVPKIIKVYGKNAYDFKKNYIVVTIPFERVNNDVPVSDKGKKHQEETLLDSVSKLIIDAMRDNCNITHDQLVRDIGVAKITVYRKIKSLKDNKYIERVGSDKKGWWKVLV